MGDASGSMEVAIKTSSIIAGLLTAITSAKLCFFDDEIRFPPYLPQTIEEVSKFYLFKHQDLLVNQLFESVS